MAAHSFGAGKRSKLAAALVAAMLVAATFMSPAFAQGIGDSCDPLNEEAEGCASGFCALTFDVDTKAYGGVCCEVDCPGSCQVCSDDFSSCAPTPVADAYELPECSSTSDYCDGTSTQCVPKRAAGETCSVESDSDPNNYSRECATGACNDGFCCDRQCDGPCEACSAAAKGGGEDGVCGAALECTSATCDGDHTLTGANGETTDCSPFRCTAGGDCRDSCTSSSDCIAGTVCDTSFANGVCVADTAAAESDDSGCGVRPSDGAAPRWMLLALVAFGAWRRSRKT